MFTLAECFDDESEVEESEEERVEFLEAGEDSAETFKATEQSLDLVALLVKGTVVVPGAMRLDLGGTTGTMPRSSTSCRVSSPS
jgi:hypothetical protein